jgi:hypothetical protein
VTPEPEPAPPAERAEPALRRSVEQASRLAVGAVGAAVDAGARLLLSEESQPHSNGPTAGDAVVGALLGAQERVLDAAERSARLLGRAAPLAGAVGRLPLVRPAGERISRRIDELAEVGAAERREGRVLARATVDDVVAHTIDSEFLATTVEQVVAELLPSILEKALPSVLDQLAAEPELLVPMVEAMLGPILDAALPEVMGKLNEQPEVVRELVLGQSVSIAGEVAVEVRSRGAMADDLAERIARRLTFRKPRAELPSPPRQLPAGKPTGNGS